MSRSNEGQPSDLERQQLELEIELKRNELEFRKVDQRRQEEEHALKLREIRASSWKNPLVVAVLAAAVAGAGNAVVAVFNNNNVQNVEERKAQSGLILEAIKTGDPEKASVNLKFLLDAGLITDARADAIRLYLRNRRPGTGAALPTSSGRFRLEGASILPEQIRTTLTERLINYDAYLTRLGIRSTTRQMSVVIDAEGGSNAYFDQETGSMRVSPDFASDPFAALWAYSQFALQEGTVSATWEDMHADGLFSGVSDYLTASFLNDPKVGAGVAAIQHARRPYLRNLENRLSYASVAATREATAGLAESHQIGEVWGGAFWEMRQRLGRERTDRLLAQTWLAARGAGGPNVVPTFLRSLRARARALGQNEAQIVESILRSRGFPLPAA